MMVRVVHPKHAKRRIKPIPMPINGNPSLAKGNRLLMRDSLFMDVLPYGGYVVAVIFILSGVVNEVMSED